MTKELESIIGNSEYIILKNGEILEGSLESLDFSKSVELKLIHIIDKNVDIPPYTKIGVDLEEDKKRGFLVSAGGVTVVPKGAKL